MADSWGAAETNGAQTVNGGFESNNNGFGTTEGDTGQEEAGRIQEDKVNKKKLSELEDDGKLLQIFTRSSKNLATVPFTAVKNIPLAVATICSTLFYEHFIKKRKTFYIIEDVTDLAPWEFVLDWIKQCGEERGVANLPEIKDMATPETGFKPFIDIMIVAAKLKIPAASFNKFMLKKMTFMARDYLIDLETVKDIFDSGNPAIYDLELQEVAATSIFSHWYDYKLDDIEHDDYMCKLTHMRENIPELDAALHKALEDKDTWLKAKRQERREKQASEEAGGGGGWGATDGDNGDSGTAENAGGGDGDAWANQGAAGATDDWVNKDTAATNDWDKTDTAPDATASWATNDGAASGDWAEEMNDNRPLAPAVTAGGGW